MENKILQIKSSLENSGKVGQENSGKIAWAPLHTLQVVVNTAEVENHCSRHIFLPVHIRISKDKVSSHRTDILIKK